MTCSSPQEFTTYDNHKTQLDAVADGGDESDGEAVVSGVPHGKSAGGASSVTAGELQQVIETLRSVADHVESG